MNEQTAYSVKDLDWDTKYFAVKCGQVTLYKPIAQSDLQSVLATLDTYQFVSIVNRHCNPVNSIMIGQQTNAFLVDVNIQFLKQASTLCRMPHNISLHDELQIDQAMVDMSVFPFSRFSDDPGLARRGGRDVYRHWLTNSFGKPGKCFAIAKGVTGSAKGYALFSCSDLACTVELIAVDTSETRRGVGASLMDAVEFCAIQRGYTEVRVGTQLRNLRAINFYQKCGYRQVENHQVYHLWNTHNVPFQEEIAPT